jgi:class 3 adenylate cyclase
MAFFREHVDLGGCAAQIPLLASRPSLSVEALATGVDNLRHDVYLSPKFSQLARTHIMRLIVQHGNVDDLCGDQPTSAQASPPSIVLQPGQRPQTAADFKDALLDLLTSALARAKNENNLCLERLCRLAVLKLLRQELAAQFATAMERCHARVRMQEGPRQYDPSKAIGLRDRTARFQMARKSILRKAGQELFSLLRELEKGTLARMRRSLFGNGADEGYELFLNRLLFVEDGRDDFLSAEHYVLLGNYESDPDRFVRVEAIAGDFLQSLGYGLEDGNAIDALLNEPDNARALLDSAEAELPMQKKVLEAWVTRLQRENVLTAVVAAYKVAPLLAEYSPFIHPQQLKQALISNRELKRVKSMIDEHGRLSPDNLLAAAQRVERCRAPEKAKLAGLFLRDFLRYHRDLRRLEAVNAALDTINLITSHHLRELSAINRTLYEFSLSEEHQAGGQRVIHHVILKADIRDSTSLTRTLLERGLNPASYFSLNFYEPVNKLLSRYGAQKLFLEGDAIILGLFERQDEAELGVGRACALALEIHQIVRACNEHSRKAGLPPLELGIGIAYQDSAPMYLMDGTTPVMISPALNHSDRLSSCSRSARRFSAGIETVFNVFMFQTVDDADTAGQPEEFLIRYNIGGVVLDDAAFHKLKEEISLTAYDVSLPTLWDEGEVRIYTGMVPVAPGIIHNLAIREGRVPHIDAREYALRNWTDRWYYEVCSNPMVYEYLAALESNSRRDEAHAMPSATWRQCASVTLR